jgi:hypothetical protein
MSDGYWDAEYDRAYIIIEEAEEILKSKNLTFEDIMTSGEIKDFNTAPRIKDAEVILNRAKKINQFDQVKCDWKHNASCCADTNCADDCEMVCKYK